MIPVQILIPVSDNAGLLFPAPHDAIFEVELIRLFSGYSKLPGLVTGGWVDAGVEYTDQHRVYEVFVRGMVVRGRRIREMVRFAKIHYRQLKVTVKYLDQAEIL